MTRYRVFHLFTINEKSFLIILVVTPLIFLGLVLWFNISSGYEFYLWWEWYFALKNPFTIPAFLSFGILLIGGEVILHRASTRVGQPL